jgi:hypothetical protein
MGFDWTILWSLRKQIGIGIVVLAVAIYIGAIKHQVTSRDEQIADLNAELVAKGAIVLNLQTNLAFTEGKLTDFVDAGKKFKANADFWHKSYSEQRKEFAIKLDTINSWKPANNEGDCDATKRFLHDYRTSTNSLRP